MIKIVRAFSNIRLPLFTISLLFGLFILAAHVMASSYIFIGQREVDKDNRFDNKTMFDDLTNKNFIDLPKVSEMSILEMYTQFLYLSAGTMGAVMYGDIIPFTFSE